MEYDEALEVGQELRDAGIESHGRLSVREDAPEFGEGHSLRLKTKNRTVTPALMGLLSENDVSLTYLGETDSFAFNAEWLVESVN